MALTSAQTNSEAGYTLVESVVAMTLFLSVVIPLIGSVGNFFLNADSSVMSRALQIAQEDIYSIELSSSLPEEREELPDGFTLVRNIRFTDRIGQLTVTVFRGGKQLCILHRIIRLQR